MSGRPIPVAMWTKAWVYGCLLAVIAGSNTTSGMDVCPLWVSCVVRSFCDGPITCPEESFRVWYV